MLIETHAHLDYPEFAADFDDVLQRANQAGVKRIITIGTSVESSRHAVNLAEKYPSVFAAIGVHPTYAEQAGEDVITPLRELAKSSRVVAIGETGLDFHHLPSVEAAKVIIQDLPPFSLLVNRLLRAGCAARRAGALWCVRAPALHCA